MKKTLTCIRCPIGCTLDIEYNEEEMISVSGNQCKRGIEYAKKEVFNPERIVTSTAYINSKMFKRLPVKTNCPVPKDLTFKVVEAASKIEISVPVKTGDVLIPDILGTGADLVATQTILE